MNTGVQTIPGTGAYLSNAVAAKSVAPQDQALVQKCREFESLLYAAMLHTMRRTVEKSDLFSGGHAEELYTSLLDDEYAKIMSDNARHGIAEALYQQLARPSAVRPHEGPVKG